MLSDYTVLDIETTGLSIRHDKIIEIAAVKVRGGRVAEEYVSFVKPGKRLGEEIMALTGIREQELKHAPDPSLIIPEVLSFIGEDVLVGHQISFDYAFLKKAAAFQKLGFEKQGIDTLKIARKLLPDLESKSLSYLCSHYHIPLTAHRALEDARATKTVYERLGEEGRQEEIFAPKQLAFRVKKETPVTKPQKEQLYKLMDRHKLVIDHDVDMLSRNEASRIIDRILAAYGR